MILQLWIFIAGFNPNANEMFMEDDDEGDSGEEFITVNKSKVIIK